VRFLFFERAPEQVLHHTRKLHEEHMEEFGFGGKESHKWAAHCVLRESAKPFHFALNGLWIS